MIIVGTTGTNIAPAEEIKERIILRSELKELKFLFDGVDAKIVKIKNKIAPIYSPSAEIREITLIITEYHPYVKETIIDLNKAIKDMGEETTAIASEKSYSNIEIIQSLAIKINKALDDIIKQLERYFPEI
ncbi:MAG: hypothetical protein AAB464_01245 [Patescibacteria group bacterium]